ncbi:MAG: hypothetical protein CMJ46_03715 [Planctomyces sp.]|nr:hypothetical protein [Planctomyces sp.]
MSSSRFGDANFMDFLEHQDLIRETLKPLKTQYGFIIESMSASGIVLRNRVSQILITTEPRDTVFGWSYIDRNGSRYSKPALLDYFANDYVTNKRGELAPGYPANIEDKLRHQLHELIEVFGNDLNSLVTRDAAETPGWPAFIEYNNDREKLERYVLGLGIHHPIFIKLINSDNSWLTDFKEYIRRSRPDLQHLL